MRWENKNICRWPTLLVISVTKIVVNRQFQFNLSSKMWSHVILEHSVELLKMKCLPCLYYGLRSLEFAVNSAFRKIITIKSYDVVSDCVKNFNCSVSNSIYKRKTNFLAKLKCSDNVLIGLFSNVISMELFGLQLI